LNTALRQAPATAPPWRASGVALLGLVVLAGLALRLWGAAPAPIKENDHGLATLAALLEDHRPTPHDRLHGLAQPALFRAVFTVAPRQVATVFTTNAIIGALVVLLVGLLAHRLTGAADCALFAAAAAAANPWHVRISASESPYGLLQAAFVAALLAAALSARGRRLGWVVVATAATVLLVHVRAEALPLALVVPAAAWLASPSPPPSAGRAPTGALGRRDRCAIVLAALVVLVGAAFVAVRAVDVWTAARELPAVQGPGHILDTLPALFHPRLSLLAQRGMALPWLPFAVPVIVTVGALALVRAGRARAAGLIVIALLVAAAVFLPYRNSLVERFRVQSNLLPMVFVLWGVAWAAARRWAARRPPWGTVAAVALGALCLAQPLWDCDTLRFGGNARAAWEAAVAGAAAVADHHAPDVTLVHLDAREDGGRILTAPPAFLFARPGRTVRLVAASELLSRGPAAPRPGELVLWWRGASCVRFQHPPAAGVSERPGCQAVRDAVAWAPVAERTVLSAATEPYHTVSGLAVFGVYRQLSPL